MAAAASSQATPRSRTGTLVVAALVVVLAWQLAHWTWVFLAPPATSAPAPDSPADLAVAARLFNGTLSGASTASAAAASSLRLKGVVAPVPGTAASAIFNLGSGKDVSIFIGNEVQPGVKLVEVLPDAAIVSRAGARERIELEARKSGGPGAAKGAIASGLQFRLNIAQSGNSFALSRKELDETLKDPQQLNYLGRIGPGPGGGVKMEAAPAGSLPAKLGLQPGDVIKKINGQAVTSAGDLALLYQRFATINTVQAEVLRGGNMVYLSYSINP